MPTTSLSTDPSLAHYARALDAYQSGHFEAASDALANVFALNPDHAEGLHLRGLVAFALNDADSAAAWIERAIEVEATAVFYNSLCVVQTRSRRFIDAVKSARCGLALNPGFDVLNYNLGLALQLQDRLEDAAACYRRTLELTPDHSAACNNMGTVLKALDDLQGAESHYRHAVHLDPQNVEARSNLGHVLLALGRYEEAWPYFEDRWAGVRMAIDQPRHDRPRLPLPQWTGGSVTPQSASSAEKPRRLLVVHEQGFGDSLQFARYLPMALERFSQVGFVCPPPLRRLFEQSFSSRWPDIVLLDAWPDDPTEWDWYSPLLSLPMAFGTRLDTIPSHTPYLHADPALVASWRERFARLPDADLPRAGIVWAGGNTGWSADTARSLVSAQITPLLALDHVRWVSLQKADDHSKRADANNTAGLIDWMDDVADFADTAALIANLDLVVSVDTSVAHLAAAMGKPVWLLNRFAGCWRWLRGRDDSPWYPGLRVITQQRRGEWSDVLQHVIADLQTAPLRQ
ncbi:tetratricopeptide repeat protein [Paraburkholderia sp. BCC1886]|uniref:tetratricopeptide repeat-containing glycosyltransferase family protein n=1 Tax=Paraburkholderia sp. BCC1886 TaxID=2562670 RepID=UPI00118438FB|nr:tetratricopeptide repeat-containing glycosyltransferase family protein [Paraburkholderia sp. BCC1886]